MEIKYGIHGWLCSWFEEKQFKARGSKAQQLLKETKQGKFDDKSLANRT